MTLAEFLQLPPREQGRIAAQWEIEFNPYPPGWPERREYNIGLLLAVIESAEFLRTM